MAWVGSLFGIVWTVLKGFLSSKSDPTLAQVVDSNARAQEQLTQAENANASLEKSAVAGSAADAAIVRAVSSQTADNDPGLNAALKNQFPGEFRD